MLKASTGLSSKTRFWMALTVGLLLGGAFTRPLAAQQSGNITGVVSDPTSAALPNATATLTNEETHSLRTATTDSTGTYRIDGVLVGTYDLRVEATNFKASTRNAIVIVPGQLVRVDVPMQVGGASETVNVSGEGAVLQTDSPAVTTSLPSITYKEIPVVTMTRGALIGERAMTIAVELVVHRELA